MEGKSRDGREPNSALASTVALGVTSLSEQADIEQKRKRKKKRKRKLMNTNNSVVIARGKRVWGRWRWIKGG